MLFALLSNYPCKIEITRKRVAFKKSAGDDDFIS